MHQRHALAFVYECVLDRAAHQPLRARGRDRLYAHAGVPANLFLSVFQHFIVQKLEQLFRFRRAGLPLDADINVFGVLAEDEHVHFFRCAHGGGNTWEVAHRALAGVKIQKLPQRHVQRADAAANRRGKRPFNGHTKITNGVHGIVRQPFAEGLERLFTGKHLEPRHSPLPAVGLLHGRVKHPSGRFPDVTPRSISLDKRNNRRIRHLQFAAAVTNRLAI